MSDEEVIRRRLLIDGDGTGDDRRLNNLLKTVIKWTNTEELTAEENDAMVNRIITSVNQIEFAEKRTKLLEKGNEKQIELYKKKQAQTEIEIEEVKKKIEISKARLEEAQMLKRNRMQYDLLAQSIKELPPRSVTEARVKALKAKVDELKKENDAIDKKLDERKRQFSVFSSSSSALWEMLEQESDEAMNTSLDDIANSPGPEAISE